MKPIYHQIIDSFTFRYLFLLSVVYKRIRNIFLSGEVEEKKEGEGYDGSGTKKNGCESERRERKKGDDVK